MAFARRFCTRPSHIRGTKAGVGSAAKGVPDLSQRSAPVGALFPLASAAHHTTQRVDHSWHSSIQWHNFALSEGQIRFFWQNGYVSNIKVLDDKQCDLLAREVESFMQPTPHPGHDYFYEFHANQTNDPSNVLMHCLGHWRISPGFHDLVYLPAITVPTSQLLREDSGAMHPVRFWHDQLFVKPPLKGGNVAWHQDYSYWTRTVPINHLTVHIALDDQTEENGTLQFVPGSHRWTRDGLPLPITADDFVDMKSIYKVLTDEERAAFRPVPSLLKRGEASFHHPLTVHGSIENRSSSPRRAAVVNYFGHGTTSATDEPLLDGVPVVQRGKQLNGHFFPLVFDPKWGC